MPCAVTFLLRFLSIEYTNDHFVHLSRGAQILYGDVPTRDFFDPGLVGQYYASAAAFRLTRSGGRSGGPCTVAGLEAVILICCHGGA